MIDHFIYLRLMDVEYARQAVVDYLSMPDCPCPNIREDVKAAWENLKLSENATSAPESKLIRILK